MARMREAVLMLMQWEASLRVRWAVAVAVFAGTAALFHPLFLVLGGVVGAVTFGVAALGGFLLGPKQGALYGLASGLLTIPLWQHEYGFALTETLSGPLVTLAVGWLGGAARHLLHRQRQQTRALQQANEALTSIQLELLQAERLALFGEVAAGVAHEMNQPLAIIGLAAEMAGEHLAHERLDRVPKQLAKIREQVERAGSIIRRLRVSGQGGDDPAIRTHDLNAVVRTVMPQFEPQFQALGIDLVFSLESGLPLVHCRPHQLQQVLTYLLLNARDAVQSAPEKRVRVSTYARNDQLVMEVSDTGSGMTAEVRARIFDPFYTTKEVGKGSGLGLSISYRLVRSHGGSIQVDSAPGNGTRFRVSLPAAGAGAGEPGVAAAPPGPSAA